MKRILFFATLATLAVFAIALGVIISSLLAQGVERAQQTVPVAEARAQKELTLDQLKNFPGMHIYWLGEEYNGLRVVKVKYSRDPGSPGVGRPAVEYVEVIYASCKPGHPANEGSTEGYCSEGEEPTFVSIRTDRFCLNQPSFLVESHQDKEFKFGNATTQFSRGGNLHIYMGDSTVIVTGSEGEEVAKKATGSLRAANAKAIHTAFGGPPMAEENCAGFVLPDPPQLPTAIPTETPTAEPTATPTGEPTVASTVSPTATAGSATSSPTPTETPKKGGPR